jgi:RNA polymerase sigma factor (sigma-70 family)
MNDEVDVTDLSDAQLIVGSVDSEVFFTELYDRHVHALLAWFVRRTGCAQTAADLTAETFAAAFSSRRRFRDIGAPGRAWLFSIAHHQLNRYLRRERVDARARKRLGVPRIELDPEDLERVERLADFGPFRVPLAAAIRQLPAAQSDAIRLRIVDDFPYDEVARRLGCSEGAARVRVSRGLVRLAEIMETSQ